MSYDPRDPVRRLAGWGLWWIYWQLFKFGVGVAILWVVVVVSLAAIKNPSWAEKKVKQGVQAIEKSGIFPDDIPPLGPIPDDVPMMQPGEHR